MIDVIRDMIYKEEHILFPLAIDTLNSEEWERVRNGEEEIGFAWIGEPQMKRESKETLYPQYLPSSGAVNLGDRCVECRAAHPSFHALVGRGLICR